MILGTEVNEFVSNRQQSKIQYLAQENKYLQEYIFDLENALRLNKQAMSITIGGGQKKGNQDSTMSMSSPQNQQYEHIIKNLNEENIKMLEGLSRQQKNMAQMQTKLLLQEQIAEEQQNYYKDLIGDLEYKLIELKRNIHDKEYSIQELERMKPIQERDGQLVKLVEIVTPSEQNLKLHEELENVRSVLNKISCEAQLISDINNQLKEVNYNLKRERIKLRIVLRSQVSYQVMKDFVYNEYLDRSDQNIEINHEIQNHRQKLEQLHNEMYGLSSLGYGFSPEPQQLKYLSKNERMIYQEKLHKMEMMVKGFKELFEKEKFNYQHTVRLYNELCKKYEAIVDTNELLIKSNQLKEIKLDKLQAELQFYRKQSGLYMEQLRQRKPYNNSISLNQEQDIAVGIFSPRFVTQQDDNKQIQKQSSYFATSKSKLSSCDEQSVQKVEAPIEPVQNVKISRKPNLKPLEIDEPNDVPIMHCQTARYQDKEVAMFQQTKYQQYYDMSKQECIDFLISMSLDFFQHFDVSKVQKQQLMKQMEEPNCKLPTRSNKFLRRSNSDPFSYFSDMMMDQVLVIQPPKQSVLTIHKNEIQTILNEIQEKRKDYDPFQIDISNIDDRKLKQPAPQSTRQTKNVLIDVDNSFISNYEQ